MLAMNLATQPKLDPHSCIVYKNIVLIILSFNLDRSGWCYEGSPLSISTTLHGSVNLPSTAVGVRLLGGIAKSSSTECGPYNHTALIKGPRRLLTSKQTFQHVSNQVKGQSYTKSFMGSFVISLDPSWRQHDVAGYQFRGRGFQNAPGQDSIYH
jgi:hypothetical protein